jgi:hypothetical protein
MKTIQLKIHPLSAILGAVVVCIGFITLGAASIADVQRVAVINALSIQGAYDPREAVVIREGTPYIVPTGRIFVLTALGSNGDGSSKGESAELTVDGQLELSIIRPASTTSGGERNDSTVRPVPTGFTVSSGSTIEVDGLLTPLGRAWGYLVDA